MAGDIAIEKCPSPAHRYMNIEVNVNRA